MAKKQQPAKPTKPATEETAPAAPAVEETSEAPVTEANASTAPAAPEPTAAAPDAASVTTDASPTEAQDTAPPAPAEESAAETPKAREDSGETPEDPAADAVIAHAAGEIAAVMGSTSEAFAPLGEPLTGGLDTPALTAPPEQSPAPPYTFSETSLPTHLDAGDVLTLKITPPRPTIDTVLRALARGTRAPGYASNSPHCVLSGPQAVLQAKIYTVLTDQGLQLPEQGYVYGWLLDQILASLNEADAAARG